MNIIFEDEDILIVEKDKNCIVHPGIKKEKNTLFHKIKNYFLKNKKFSNFFIIHRLDKDTTGLIIVAKNIQVKNTLKNMMKNRKIIKEYDAIVNGKMLFGGKIQKPILKIFPKKKKLE
ncbi:pseudouridine synthase [bacterium endosymbiont of Pedicinus badii]|uniref:pseudouridine synthase n=1 Tax=bacterium endosymbiont of Pedicinus badii TaxID=1719126 RepID=UPI0009BBFF65|nr:pseudouridine synthase [bacterium endosymbiont of Pedicinus badii]OQM34254.1 hypothetical protein AOQ89_02905 [bacterium endosymbiont of Pedicinus badii]